MSSPKPWWRHWFVAYPIGIVVGVVVAVLAALQVQTHADPVDLPPAGDRIDAAVAALRTDPFYAAPEVASRLTQAERAKITRTLRGADVPTYLVYWNTEGDQGYYLDSDALEQIMAAIGRDGEYAIVNERQESTLRSRGMRHGYVGDEPLNQRIGPGLVAYAHELADQAGEELGEPFDYWGGPGGGFAAGALMAGLGFGCLLLLVWIAGRVVRRRDASS